MSSGKHLTRTDKRDTGFIARLRTRFSCMLGNHEPNRNKVRRAGGVHYVGTCRFCGVTIGKRHGHPWKRISAAEYDATRIED
ncbi:hypothetical protein [Novosphingobium sp.]|uniref:hypothetical protein n=1 Tax=Novosphingobium sp. TaxID=1874826 RepID=UPI003B522D7F